MPTRPDVTTVLAEIRFGAPGARERLFKLIHDDLRRIAGSMMKKERPGHTLQPTALVNEAWIRLASGGVLDDAQNRRHFFSAAARAMWRTLADHARKRNTEMRGGGYERVPFDELFDPIERYLEQERLGNVLDLDEALQRLGQRDKRQAEMVLQRYFGGLKNEEIAAEHCVSVKTVELDLRTARAWLRSQLSGGRSDAG